MLTGHDCRRGENGAEAAGGEVVERMESANELGAGYTALTIERAQEVGGGALALAGVAFPAARDQVAVRVGTELGAGYDVIEALHLRADAAEAVKADAPFAGMDGLAELGGAHKIDFLEVAAVRRGNGHACLGCASASAGNLFRQANVDHVARFAALDQPQGAVLYEPAQRGAHGFHGEAKIPRQPNDGKMKARLAFKPAVPQKMVINGSVGGGEAQTRGKSVLELLADEFGVGLIGFHDEIREMEWSAKRRQRCNTESTEARAQRTRRKKLTVDGRNWEITEEKKKRPQGCPSYTRGKPALQNGLNTGLAAGNLGHGGPKKRNAPTGSGRIVT